MRQKVWRIGKIDDLDYSENAKLGLARVQITDKAPGILTKPLPVIFPFTATDKAYFMPKVGDIVTILTDENCEDGIILGSIYTAKNRPPVESETTHFLTFEDGTSLQYDTETKELTIYSKGNLTLSCDGILTLSSAGIIINAPWVQGQDNFNLTWQGYINIDISQDFTLTASQIFFN